MPAREMTQTEIDAMYAAIVHAHEGLDADASHMLNACAVFLLAQSVSDQALRQILDQSRQAALRARAQAA